MPAHPIPAFRVALNGRDLTARIAPRLLDLTLTEQRGDEADQLDIRIHKSVQVATSLKRNTP